MNEYAKAGVDPNKVRVFERVMKGIAQRTRYFPESRKVMVTQMAHSAGFQYVGSKKHSWGTTKEGLGNKNWLAEWMYKFGDMKPHYQEIRIDVVLIAAKQFNNFLKHVYFVRINSCFRIFVHETPPDF